MALPFELNKGGKIDSIPGDIVLQIAKITNVAAPKSNQESKAVPRLIKLELTDGQIQFPGLEFEQIPQITLNTPPGTKIYLKNGPIKILNGYFVLTSKNIEILGGTVEELVDKWRLNKSLSKYSRSVVKPNTGAPSWSLFGQKIETIPDEKSFKSLSSEKEQENAEFNLLRSKAIDDVKKLMIKEKVFGGGGKRIIDFNVQKMVDKGYTHEQANYALKTTRNNLQKAFGKLKMQKGDSSVRSSKRPEIEAISTSKPSGKISLFDFLEDKLPPSLEQVLQKPAQSTGYTSKPYEQNNRNSSNFNKNYDQKSSYNNHSNNNSNQKPSYSKNYDQKSSYNHKSNSYNKTDDQKTSYKNYEQNSRPQKSYEQNNSKTQNYNNNTKNYPLPSFNSKNQKSEQVKPEIQPDIKTEDDYNKFQNNMSSSFASRQPKQDYSQYRGTGSRAMNYSINHKVNKTTENYNRFNGPTPPYRKPEKPNSTPQSKDTNLNYQKNKPQQFDRAPPPRFQKPIETNEINKITEKAANLKISTQQQPKQGNQFPSGFAYNPHKIVGFQNKEGNEFAMNVLRTQQPPPFGNSQQAQSQQYLHQNNHQQQQQQQPPSQQQQFSQPQNFVGQQQHQRAKPSQQPQQPQQPNSQNFQQQQFQGGKQWKIGDKCIAKYWEDGGVSAFFYKYFYFSFSSFNFYSTPCLRRFNLYCKLS